MWTNLTLLAASVLVAITCGGVEATPELASDELRPVADKLFTSFSRAAQTQDAAAFRELLVADIRERCSVEEIEASLEGTEILNPQMEVRTVYIDVGDSDRALIEVAAPVGPGGDILEGLATAFIVAFPWPMARENGEWRMGLPSMLHLIPGEDCPFAADSESYEVELAAPAPIGPEGVSEPLRLGPPPGAKAIEGESGVGRGTRTSRLLLETNMVLDELVEYYRKQLVNASVDVWEEELVRENWMEVSFTFRDDKGMLWFGELNISLVEGLLWSVGLFVSDSPS